MLLPIIIHKPTHRLIVAPRHHPRRRLLRREFLLVLPLVGRVGRVAPDHFLVLGDRDAAPLELLDVLEPAEDFVLHDEVGGDLVGGAFFDGEGVLFEGGEGVGGGEVEGYGGAVGGGLRWAGLEGVGGGAG